MDYTKDPIYEWDAAKNAACVANRNLDFVTAIAAFDDPYRIIDSDNRHDYREQRWRLLGTIKGRLHCVIYTLRKDKVRIISARKANHREVKQYEHSRI
ncbi:MAG TPA: BrnT family toxin [Oceanospirillaceae bacterium]|nr:BrnT family toxin [Oceanospirillaceae bacterium]